MSAPDTNVKKQKKRHKPSLIAIVLAVAVAGLLLFWMLSRVLITEPETPDQAAPQQVEETRGLPAEGSSTDLGTDGPADVLETTPTPAE